ncbi:MAG: hypothetical protein A2289_10585 [Deltaproteobacteria bacterium RIFOXYA12_FULL_58_15]|nr:MAG: hypothetical protein A2289_10585 [Deltaproteobacteria bacterium RIFOXYA12_FULL_58_15]OGR11940.1 MAG: hypothetical protein A2341_17235 [Deltaproteobacteria bacterium RIFOXYB12_FULL_58_9]
MSAVRVPLKAIDPESLQRLVEEFVTRDGTDYGLQEKTLLQKRDAVVAQLSRGDVAVVFDTESETFNIVGKGDLPPE